jgi:hypothetical protein
MVDELRQLLPREIADRRGVDRLPARLSGGEPGRPHLPVRVEPEAEGRRAPERQEARPGVALVEAAAVAVPVDRKAPGALVRSVAIDRVGIEDQPQAPLLLRQPPAEVVDDRERIVPGVGEDRRAPALEEAAEEEEGDEEAERGRRRGEEPGAPPVGPGTDLDRGSGTRFADEEQEDRGLDQPGEDTQKERQTEVHEAPAPVAERLHVVHLKPAPRGAQAHAERAALDPESLDPAHRPPAREALRAIPPPQAGERGRELDAPHGDGSPRSPLRPDLQGVDLDRDRHLDGLASRGAAKPDRIRRMERPLPRRPPDLAGRRRARRLHFEPEEERPAALKGEEEERRDERRAPEEDEGREKRAAHSAQPSTGGRSSLARPSTPSAPASKGGGPPGDLSRGTRRRGSRRPPAQGVAATRSAPAGARLSPSSRARVRTCGSRRRP